MAAGAAHVVGLFGKLPAHGDFVRRGGPAAVLGLIDRWLDRELGAVVATGLLLDDAVDALDGAHGAFAHDGNVVLAALIAGADGVGRRFPLVATLTGTPARRDAAAAWCAAAGDALAVVRDGSGDGDAALAAIAAITPPAAAPDAVTGWWRGGGEALPADAPPAWRTSGTAETDQTADAALPDGRGGADGAATGEPAGAGLPGDPRREDAVIATDGPADAALPAATPARRWWRPARAAVPAPVAAATMPAATGGPAPAPALPTGAAFRALLAEGRR